MKVTLQSKHAIVTTDSGKPLTGPLPVAVAERMAESGNKQREFVRARESARQRTATAAPPTSN